MKNKKGFTLIELLAVIVILAVIALIAVPQIMDIINDTRINSYKDSVMIAMRSSDLYAETNGLDLKDGVNITDLNLKNSEFISGKIYFANGVLNADKITDGNYCANGGLATLIITEGPCDTLKPQYPNVTSSEIYGDSITYNLTEITSTDGGIDRYEYYLSDNIEILNDDTVATGLSNSSDITIDKDTHAETKYIYFRIVSASDPQKLGYWTSPITNYVDETDPIISNITSTNGTITFDLSDKMLYGYKITTIPAIPTIEDNIDGDVSTYSVTYDTPSVGTYYIHVKDAAGHIKSSTGIDANYYSDSILNGTDPIIGTNMIPVTIADDGTVTYANIYNKWYDYTAKEWANAVILSSGTYNVGDIIPESSIESYFVWIPRYKYKLFDLGNYTSTISSVAPASVSEEIDVVFETKDVVASTGSSVGEYLTHPAFITFNTNGLWVAKFETGYLGATTIENSKVVSSDSNKIIAKPNVYSWRNNTVYNIFLSSYNYDRTNDSHMIKNTEWGAISYLSLSQYGTNMEISMNNNSNHLTGFATNMFVDQSDYPGEFGTDTSKTYAYNTSTGYKATSTGNITGIYDMSGGAWEYTSGYRSGTYGSSGFNSTTIANYNSKYFDVYNSNSTITSFNNRILGDATGEIGPFYAYNDGDSSSRVHNAWYLDYGFYVDASYPWFFRSGTFNDGRMGGQLAFSRYTGGSYAEIGSRLVLAPQ